MAKQEVFRVRLNCVDHYQTPPSSLDPPLWGPVAHLSTQRNALPQVPVIRVFGSTESGQKVCMHVHGAFPYLFIQYNESLDKAHVENYIQVLRHSIDHALALSYRRNPYDNPRAAFFVAHVSLVKGVPFFGYSVGYKYYLKIYLLNPTHMTRFADLLQRGAILARFFQPYEAHLQYLLQWMCDFSLYGCAYIETDKPYFRAPVPAREQLNGWAHFWDDVTILPEQMLDAVHFRKQSHCQLELDIRVEDILNRNAIQSRELHHSFIERLASLENLPPEEKLVHSMAGLWKDETKRRKLRMGLKDPSSSPFPPEVLVSMSADPRNTEKGGWIHEEELREMVEQLASQERHARGDGIISFDGFLSQNQRDDGVQTVLDSATELFHDALAARVGLRSTEAGLENGLNEPDYGLDTVDGRKPGDESLVDMSSIAGIPQDDDYGSDEEVAQTMALTQRKRLQKALLQNNLEDSKLAESADNIEPDSERTEDEDVLSEDFDNEQKRKLKRPAQHDIRSPLKRPRLDAEDERPPSRQVSFRVKDMRPERPASHSNNKHAGNIPRSSQRVVRFASEMPPSAQLPSSQRSSLSSQNMTLPFPIVKNANDRDSSPSSSQRHESARNSKMGTPGRQKEPLSDSPQNVRSTPPSAQTSPVSPRRPVISPKAVANYASAYGLKKGVDVFIFGDRPPTFEEVETTVSPSVIYQDAYYSNEQDVPQRPREYAGQEFKLDSLTLPYLPPFEKTGTHLIGKGVPMDKAKEELVNSRRCRQCTLKAWEIVHPPPTYDDVEKWAHLAAQASKHDLDELDVDGPPSNSHPKRKSRLAQELSQVEGPTQKGQHGFKLSQRKKTTSVQHETGYMSIMSLEVHVNSRGDLAPDPERDPVNMVVWCVADEQMEDDAKLGLVVLSVDDELSDRMRKAVGNQVQVDAEDNELDLINRMVDIVRVYDPDILTGYEVHNGSWGYLIERARLHYEFNLLDEFSRMKAQSHGRFGKDADRWGFNQTSTVRITGRHTINIWRAMRSELNLLQYTMENVVFHVLRRRIPHYTFATLTRWYRSDKPKDLAKALDYFTSRAKLDLEILESNELIARTSEQARLLGVDFFSVFSRGSQFKVESLMFRIAKPESFVLVSPSRKQVGAQNALECLPLVMEPQSAFYSSPLLVLDFQSLYPSVMIAYNYCYSTCLGRIVNWRGTNKLGFADFQRAPGLLELVKDKLNIAPNGMMYVKPEMRKSLLAKMLGEILETRVMVKSGMKVDKDDKTLQQLLNNRQLALKLIANVTYGYTSASFSGRMPCSEIADSIVQTGRETLEKAIALIHSVERWGAEVVYGDTDSLFVYLKGRTRDDAFKIGDEIAKAVTDVNPRPVKLKFEKVYHPCVLLAKKRYVGFKYESPKQTEPEFDAKGIETVRRDGTPAEQKIEEKALKLLFRTSDLSEVKRYFQDQCTKIMTGRFSVQDFCFAKEVKLGTYADKGPPPPGALIATRRMLRDPRTEPQYGERIPYVVIAGAPGARLWERCVEPERLIHDEHAELDAEYYISKNLIPPLERIFNLVGANVRQWYDEMPKVQRIRMLGGPREGKANGAGKKTMESYMGSSLCLVCRTKLPPVPPHAQGPQLPLCEYCMNVKTQDTLLDLRRKLQKAENKAKDMLDVCRSCAGLAPGEEVCCDSRDCPVFYSRVKASTQLTVALSGVGEVAEVLEKEVVSRLELTW